MCPAAHRRLRGVAAAVAAKCPAAVHVRAGTEVHGAAGSLPVRPWPDDPYGNLTANDPDPDQDGGMMPAAVRHRLAQGPDGRVAEAELAALAGREAVAVAGRDYRLAAQLRDLQEVLRPRPAGPLKAVRDCAPRAVEDQLGFFLKQGFCVLPNAVQPALLQRLQAAWRQPEAAAREQWQRDRAGGGGIRGQNFAVAPVGGPRVHRTFFDIPEFLEQDDAFLDLIDLPAVVRLVEKVCGLGSLHVEPDRSWVGGFPASDKSAYHGVAQCSGFQARVVPSDGNADGYISWHRGASNHMQSPIHQPTVQPTAQPANAFSPWELRRPPHHVLADTNVSLSRRLGGRVDKPPADCWPLPGYRVVKALVFLSDVPANAGATAVVPGSHRLPQGPRQTLLGRFTRGGQDVGGGDDGDNSEARPPSDGPALHHSAMPNHVACAVAAGTAVRSPDRTEETRPLLSPPSSAPLFGCAHQEIFSSLPLSPLLLRLSSPNQRTSLGVLCELV